MDAVFGASACRPPFRRRLTRWKAQSQTTSSGELANATRNGNRQLSATDGEQSIEIA